MGFDKYVNLLKRELTPALGCTEPIAVAYASAKAREVLGSIPERVEVLVSGNILKNGMGVGIPKTKMTGLDIAAALGLIGGNAEAKLEVLKDIEDKHIEEAVNYLKENRLKVKLKDVKNKLYIEIVCFDGQNESKVIIKDKHTNIVHISLNKDLIYEKKDDEVKECNNCNEQEEKKEEVSLTIDCIYDFSQKVKFEDIKFLLEGAKMNRRVAQEGIEKDYGLRVGKVFYESIGKGIFADSIESYAIAITSAAVDARMDGCIFPVMTTAGSGNQGLTCTLPVVAVAEKLESSEENLARALAISNLITIHIKSYLGRLSALCGCGVAAAIGSSCAITYLLGGDKKAINHSVKNMIAGLSGMICDGAKQGCALKISTSVSSAIQSAVLAINDIEVSCKDGIIHDCVEQTIKNLGNLGIEGMVDTDRVILNMMVCK
ncbi:serine dehydratase subunit alpha family protein [Clostridium amazonitimonense]|uniref:L-cysteine desulfidase family protein n=1 Tax=Clostridium amazonitimonense TaxID=1499689 RepID=UPI000509BABF|nr:L-serine ammonia-lyase, iron-sulfur-dependent, subunit alpha [Clostridium amazonitimonense]